MYGLNVATIQGSKSLYDRKVPGLPDGLRREDVRPSPRIPCSPSISKDIDSGAVLIVVRGNEESVASS